MKRFAKGILYLLLTLFILVNIITAFHAYKFTHFYTISNTGDTAKGIGSTWQIVSSILFGIKAFKKPNTAGQTDANTIYLTTKDNLKLQGWYLKTDSVAKGTVIMFHGHGGTKSGVYNESAAFRQMGFNVLMMDFRAHGSSEGNTCTIGYYEGEDVKLAFDFIKGQGEKNIVLWGISMGAAAITKAVDEYNLQPDKIILEMPFGSILKAAEGRIKMMHLPGEPLATLITFWGGVEHGFWAFNMKPAEYVKKIQCPVLLQWGLQDKRVTQGETDAIFANITTPKKLVVYATAMHESLCTKEHDKWMGEVHQFLANK